MGVTTPSNDISHFRSTKNNNKPEIRQVLDLISEYLLQQIFFKLLQQNLNVKTFVGISENAVKSQIFVALIAYLLLELLRRVKAKL